MKINAIVLLVAALTDFRQALPGYKYEFPRDHGNHPEFRTEWWYYTGNLRSTDGRRFGYELTFFRHAAELNAKSAANVWDIRDVWMAHLALSDIDGKRFYKTERLNRSGAGLAGAESGSVWNGNWTVQDGSLRAVAENFRLNLNMRSLKPPVIHGTNGVSQKAKGQGRASHYVSMTRLLTRGEIVLSGTKYSVEGFSWMDHEFFSNSLDPSQAGWDWFSLQFDDNTELMLYQLRRKDGSIEPYSSGTYVDASGKSTHLTLRDFQLERGKTWHSATTKATYPIEWTVKVPRLGLNVFVDTRLPEQELSTGKFNAYWEGAIEVRGSKTGRGYLEMTGYAAPLRMGD